jgi:hypothetical protein
MINVIKILLIGIWSFFSFRPMIKSDPAWGSLVIFIFPWIKNFKKVFLDNLTSIKRIGCGIITHFCLSLAHMPISQMKWISCHYSWWCWHFAERWRLMVEKVDWPAMNIYCLRLSLSLDISFPFFLSWVIRNNKNHIQTELSMKSGVFGDLFLVEWKFSSENLVSSDARCWNWKFFSCEVSEWIKFKLNGLFNVLNLPL